MTEGFRYKTGFDLTDYEDGTENPHDDGQPSEQRRQHRQRQGPDRQRHRP